MSRHTEQPTADVVELGPEDLDVTLAELAAVVEESIADVRSAELEKTQLAEARGPGAGSLLGRPNPRWVLLDRRLRLAYQVLDGRERMARDLAAWWADLATVAVAATISETPLHPVRAAAGDPATSLDEEDMRHLPAVSESDRDLVRLVAIVGAEPEDGRKPSLASRTGVYLYPSENGEVGVYEDPTPMGRRSRLWGDNWTDHQVPALPEPGDLAEHLARHGVPASLVEEVRQAAETVYRGLDASRRHQQLEEKGPEDDDWDAHDETLKTLQSQMDQLTVFLANYARSLSGTLPAQRKWLADQRRS
ncbi:MAG: hypothetical protein ACRDT2_05705 [Natronosporangium sp.]